MFDEARNLRLGSKSDILIAVFYVPRVCRTEHLTKTTALRLRSHGNTVAPCLSCDISILKSVRGRCDASRPQAGRIMA